MESLHDMDTLQQENRALREENERLRAEMEEALDIVSAIRQGQIDALVVQGTGEDRVYTLQSADQTYRMFVEHMQEGALTLITDGIVYYANAAFARLLGTPLESVIGTSVRQHIPEAERPMFDALIRQCLESSSRGEINLQKSDGTLAPVYISLNPMNPNEASPICMVLTDLSEQKRNEQILANERQFREILNQTVDGIVVYDTEGRVIFANAAAYGLLKDVSQEALIHRTKTREGEEALFENEKTLWTHTLHGDRFHGVEIRIEVDETNHLDALFSANPLRDSEGAVVGAVLTFTDITERKKIEQEMRDLTLDLEIKVKERTRELSRNQARLQHLVSELALTEQREKKRLSQEMHDYLAQLLVLSRMKLDSCQRKSNKEDILPLLEEVKKFLNQSLLYTRNLIADLSPQVLEDSDLLAAVHWLAEQMRRHELEVFVLDKRWKAEIKGERAILLFHIIRELLMNVMKHAQAKQAFIIFEPISADTGVITVLDHGVGFEAPSNMEEFASRQHFGLYSVQERLEAIGGHLEVVSSPNEGTQMKLVIPLQGKVG